ncbi:MAG: undecaprenyl/decaprenyl-phosphate alpha-N-acetylglucosaminyl 1-phosphate transferase [Acidimicrobiia bacterium]|nr:undecaprenyl/decaprenyl-phosphate alpha-N-acetylglucosaminyl 1-phosphate transferase [Acidimicrobiia bacterium]
MTPAHWAVLAVAALSTLLLTPVVRWVATKRGALVQPDARRVHERPTAALGGLAMGAAVLLALGVASQLKGFEEVFATPTIPIGVGAAALVAVAVGWLDEIRKVHGNGVSAPAKMAGLVLAGSILTLAGVSTVFFRVPFLGIFSLSPDLSAFVTVCWVVGMANALNFIDGLDGLAAGITAIASGAFLLYALRLDEVGVVTPGNVGPLLAVITLGVCVGFLPWNVHPARIFMGDCGALLLGTLMAAATMSVGGSTDAVYSGQSFFFLAPLFIPLVILGVPILDTAFAIVRRASRRSGVATADKGHLHHRLLKLGHGHRRAVFILWAWTALLSAAVLVPALTNRGDALVPLAIGGLFLILYTALHPSVRAARSEANGEAAAEAATPAPAPAAKRRAHERVGSVAGRSDT